ncbi:MAG TPA: hypothetical protein VL992_03845 [Tepidisphaeraceae bacterium]|nr:hypothetical protein [Tepidisphaeraceae bacterium]
MTKVLPSLFAVMVFVSCIAWADEPPIFPYTGQDARLRHAAAITEAKIQYADAMRAARAEYFKTLLAADEQYVSDLDSAVQSAMSANDLEAAKTLDDARDGARNALKAHRQIGDDRPQCQIVTARWESSGHYYDVTEKVREIVLCEDRGENACDRLFGDPNPAFSKNLVMTISRDGRTEKIAVAENAPLPDILFPPRLPSGDEDATP